MLLNAEMSSITSAQQWLTNSLYTQNYVILQQLIPHPVQADKM